MIHRLRGNTRAVGTTLVLLPPLPLQLLSHSPYCWVFFILFGVNIYLVQYLVYLSFFSSDFKEVICLSILASDERRWLLSKDTDSVESIVTLKELRGCTI